MLLFYSTYTNNNIGKWKINDFIKIFNNIRDIRNESFEEKDVISKKVRKTYKRRTLNFVNDW